MILGAILGVAFFGLFLCGEFLLGRVSPPEQRLTWNKRSAAAALVLMTLVLGNILDRAPSILASGAWLLATVWGGLTFLCLYVLYMPFYFVVTTSLSVESLRMISRNPDGRLPLRALRERFASEAFAVDRLDKMVRAGLLTRTANTYSITPKGRRAARVFQVLKRLWRLGPGG